MEYIPADKKPLSQANWKDLTVLQPFNTRTPIEAAPLEELPSLQRQFRENGVAVLENFIPHDLLDAYSLVRARLPKDRSVPDNYWAGWHYPTPYQDCRELLDLATYPDLQGALHALIGAEMGLHLALTGWVSTERKWHQDTYLNPEFLWSYYAAAWIALEDVEPEAGPFQYIKGSHNWRSLRQDKLFEFMTPEERKDPRWPTFTQDEVARVCEAEIERQGEKVSEFLPKKGDVLIWHSNLVHRGSEPKNPDLERRALICHYSSIGRRVDMDRLSRNPTNGQLYFDFRRN